MEIFPLRKYQANDGHAKNFSISIEPQGHYHLTPLYHVLSAWPLIGNGNNQISRQKLAVRGSSNYYLLNRMQRRHWIKHGELIGLSNQQIELIFDEIISNTPHVIERAGSLLPTHFPPEPVECIFNGMKQQSERLVIKQPDSKRDRLIAKGSYSVLIASL